VDGVAVVDGQPGVAGPRDAARLAIAVLVAPVRHPAVGDMLYVDGPRVHVGIAVVAVALGRGPPVAVHVGVHVGDGARDARAGAAPRGVEGDVPPLPGVAGAGGGAARPSRGFGAGLAARAEDSGAGGCGAGRSRPDEDKQALPQNAHGDSLPPEDTRTGPLSA